MNVPVVCITGGPCAGKTSILSILRQELEDLGCTVLISSEVATDLIKAGLTPGVVGIEEFQQKLIKRSIQQEDFYQEALQQMGKEKSVLICDRGCMDSLAYAGEKAFQRILESIGVTANHLLVERYEGVVFLRSVAYDREDIYTLENNEARSETLAEAKVLDEKTLHAWNGTPHLAVIDNATDLRGKARRVLKAICRVLGIPAPLEIEKKFVIDPYFDFDFSWIGCPYKEVEIEQVYLAGNNDSKHERIRMRKTDDGATYYHTTKERKGPGVNLEHERQISFEEYEKLSQKADPSCRVIKKLRLCFTWENQYFELDVFRELGTPGLCLLEIELTDENQKVSIPDLFKGKIKEVTGDKRYSNLEIARHGPPEYVR